MRGACSTNGRPEYTSAYEVLVGDVKGENHLTDLGAERTVAKAKVDPMHETKVFLTSSLDWIG
jgi:hypothetical protein